MKKLWLLVIPTLLSLLSCGFLPGTGGNPDEGSSCRQIIFKAHATSLRLEMSINCPYGNKCNVDLDFGIIKYGDSLSGSCFGAGEWRFESLDTSMTGTTELNKSYPVRLSQDDHLRFSLFDINNIEKKYDIDLSGIIHSYTVRGDSVDVHVMKDCKISVFTKPHKTEIFGNIISNDLYTFAYSNSRETWFSYKCSWKQQGPLQKDDLEVYAELHWK